MPRLIIRTATAADINGMTDVIVQSWQETYEGLVSASVLHDPTMWARRHRMWSLMMADGDPARRVLVAERDGQIVGVVVSEPSDRVTTEVAADKDRVPTADRTLAILYVLQSEYGSGAGQQLLDAALEPDESAELWVADPNPRAQAFYRKNGFADTERSFSERWDIYEIRMVRDPRQCG